MKLMLMLLLIAIGLSACTNPQELDEGSSPSAAKFSGPTIVGTGTCTSGFSLSLVSSSGASQSATSREVFTLSGLGTSVFYSDSSCTNPASMVVIESGSSSVPLYFKGNLAEMPTWTATSSSFSTVSITITVTPNPVPTQFSVTGASAVDAGVCSNVFLIALKDNYGNSVAPSTSTTVNFSSFGSAVAYSDPTCSTPITSAVIPAGQDVFYMYLKDSTTEALNLTFTIPSIGSIHKTVSIDSGAANQATLSLPTFVSAGLCQATTLTLVDALNNTASVSSATTVTLSGFGNGGFYLDANCTTGMTSLILPAYTSSQTIYFQDNVTEGLLLTTGIGSATKRVRFTSVISSPIKFVISGPLSLPTGTCSAAYTISSQDSIGNIVNVSGTTTANLTGGSFGKFYSDAACTNVITSVTINTNYNSSKFYFKDNYPEDLSLTATSGSLDGIAPVVVVSAAPSRVILAGSSAPTSGICTPYTVTSTDLFGNPSRVSASTAITLGGKGSGTFYSNSTCATTATTSTIANGAYTATFYFKDNLAENLILTGTSGSLTAGSLQVAVAGGSATKLVITGTAAIGASTCMPYTIQAQDANSNPAANVSSTVNINLTGNAAGTFYSDSGCSSSISTTTIASGTNSQTIYFKDGTAQTATLSAADIGASLTTGTLAVTVSTTKLVISGSASIASATCSTYTVQNTDSTGSGVNVGSNTSVSLTGNGTGTYYSNSGCTTTATTVSILSGANTATFYYKNNSAQQITMSATSASIAAGTLPVTIATPAPTKLVVTGSSTLAAGTCSSAYTITSQNVNSADSPVASNTTMTLIGSGSGLFYSDNTCSTPITSLVMSSGTSSKTFYIMDNLRESLYLSATATGLTTGMLNVSVTSTTPTQLLLSGPIEVTTSQCSSAYTVSSKDGNGNDSNVPSNQTVNLVSSGSGTFYTNSNCTTSTSSVVIANGTSATNFYFKSTTSEVVTLTASHASYSSAALGVHITTGLTEISAGAKHTCAVSNGGVKCWGLGANGQLGNGSTQNNAVPIQVRGLPAGSGVTAIEAGASHSCALISNSSVVCWGLNSNGQLGDTTTAQKTVPTTVVGLPTSGITAIAAGSAHTCALANGAVYCWGLSTSGQTGNGSSSNKTSAEMVTGLTSGVAAIAAGATHTCALMINGTVQCMGLNTSGQLGDGTTSTRFTPVAVQSLGGTVTAIAAGSTHTCAVISGGTVQCWGANSNGQLGDGTTVAKSAPTSMLNLPGTVTKIAAGTSFTCVVASGSLSCVGINSSGELGANSTAQSLSLVSTSNLGSVSRISLSMTGSHACAVTSGQARCWGLNDNGQLGNGYLMQSALPVEVQGIGSTASAVVAGTSHTCAILSTGAVMCWGLNSNGQLGDSSTTARSSAVQTTGLTSGATAIAAGGSHTCAIVSGAVQCWGLNTSGQLGNGSNAQSTSPTATNFTGTISALATGVNHTCVIADGGIFCSGSNANGQLGIGSTSTQFNPAQVFPAGSGATAIAAGTSHTCAIVSGVAYCWGLNSSGQLGVNNTTQATSPSPVQGISGTVSQIFAGNTHSCAITSTGAAYCWGINTNGQLGASSIAQSLIATPVTNLSSGVNTLSLSTAGAHTCSIQSGVLKCWGQNTYRQLGLANTEQAIEATVQPDLSSNVTSVATGQQHTCAIDSGVIYCWGDNSNGKLGDSAPAMSTFIPVPVMTLPL